MQCLQLNYEGLVGLYFLECVQEKEKKYKTQTKKGVPMIKHSIITLSLVSLVNFTSAQAGEGDFSVGLGASITQGVGLELGYELRDNISLRGSYYGYSLSKSKNIDDIDYDMDLDLQNTGVFIDYRP